MNQHDRVVPQPTKTQLDRCINDAVLPDLAIEGLELQDEDLYSINGGICSYPHCTYPGGCTDA